MIRIFEKNIVVEDDGTSLISAEVYCNSSDTKPTAGFANGSTLTEVDTGSQFLFDEDNEEWVEVSEGGGGGTGGGVGVISTYYNENEGKWYGLICSDPDAPTYGIQYMSADGEDQYTPILYHLKVKQEADITADYNLFTYNEDGTTTPYVGHKTIITVNGVISVNANAFMDIPIVCSDTYTLMIDADTGAIIYMEGQD